jgi:hypothetical protein
LKEDGSIASSNFLTKLKQKGTPNASLILNDEEIIKKKSLCCFKQKSKVVYAS